MARYVFTPTETRHPTKGDLTFLLRHIKHDYLSTFSSACLRWHHVEEGKEVSKKELKKAGNSLNHVYQISSAITHLANAPHLKVNDNTENQIQALRTYAQNRGCRIRTSGNVNHSYINHPGSVYLQLFNFLQNAIQAEAKDIVIGAHVLPLSKPQRAYLGRNGRHYELGDPFVHVAVADNGTGIPKRELPELFAPRDLSSKRGVGLSLVDYVCDTIHGYVTVESTVGRGSTFTLTFAQERKNRA